MLKARNLAFSSLVFLTGSLSLSSCQSQKNPVTPDFQKVKIEKSDNTVYDEAPLSKEVSIDVEPEKEEPVESNETVGKYKIKLKGPTKTLEGSIDISEEKHELLHITTGVDGSPSLFHPEIFGPENFMILQSAHPGNSYEYMIIPLGKDKLKIEKSFKAFYAPPEVVTNPKNGEFTLSFQEPYEEAGGARSVAPYVVANYRKGKLILDTIAMKNHAKDVDFGNKETIEAAFEVHTDNDSLPPEFTSEIIDRYYAGKAKEARKLFDQAWPKRGRGKEKSWNEIISMMKESPFWPQIKAMNKL